MAEETFECPICFEEVKVSETYACKNGHRFCEECWKDGIHDQMIRNYDLHCFECEDCIPNTVVLNHFLKTEEDFKFFEIYMKRLVEKAKEKYVVECPKCRYEVFMEEPKQFVECVKCREKFCTRCSRMNWHEGKTCEEYDKELKRKEPKEDEEHLKYLREETRKCPHCNARIERRDGCNPMTCLCGHVFCWLCLADIKQFKYEHFKQDHPSNTKGCCLFGYPEGYVHPPLEGYE